MQLFNSTARVSQAPAPAKSSLREPQGLHLLLTRVRSDISRRGRGSLIAFTAANQGAGVSHVVRFFAEKLASQTRRRTLVVDAPRLRELQKTDQLEALLRELQECNQKLADQRDGRGVLPLLVKLSPDLDVNELESIVAVARRNKIAGLIATNTTVDRASLKTSPETVAVCGEGGLSGAPLRRRSLEMIATLYNMTEGSLPLIGVGGVFTAEDAWEMISAGASLLQIYTGFIYEGPAIARKINDGLRRIISDKGFASLDEAVGSRAKELAA